MGRPEEAMAELAKTLARAIDEIIEEPREPNDLILSFLNVLSKELKIRTVKPSDTTVAE